MSEPIYDRPTDHPPIGRAGVQAIYLAGEIGRPAAWAARVVAQRQPGPASALVIGLFQRLATAEAPGMRAADLARRFALESLALDAIDLTISPYAPPQRQISAARQGAPMWSSSAVQRPVAPTRTAPAHVHPAGRPPARDEIPEDLRALLQLHRSLGHI
jgi:hypothetical protein